MSGVPIYIGLGIATCWWFYSDRFQGFIEEFLAAVGEPVDGEPKNQALHFIRVVPLTIIIWPLCLFAVGVMWVVVERARDDT